MTEQEWLARSHAGKMLYLLSEQGGRERKLRLFTFACCERVRHLLSDPRLVRALDGLLAYADGRLDPAGLRELADEARQAVREIEAPLRGLDGMLRYNDICSAASAVLCAVSSDYARKDGPAGYTLSTSSVSHFTRGARTNPVWESTQDRKLTDKVGDDEERVHAHLLADIIGNPFRPVVFDPSWLTSTVVSLAQGIYAERASDRMPLLMDALMDAGCADEAVLEHCRGPNTHVRGCWVIDLLLAKE